MRTFSDDAICCAVLCISTAVLDFFFFLPANSAMLDFYVPYIGISHFFAFWALSLAGSTGAMMALRAVPVVGPSLQWLAWALLTVPLRAYWLVVGAFPSDMDLFDLLSVAPKHSLGMISALLTPKIVLRAVWPTAAIALSFALVALLRCHNDQTTKRPNGKIRHRAWTFLVGALVFAAYDAYPRGEQFAADAMGRSLNVLRAFRIDLGYFVLDRGPSIMEAPRRDPKDNVLFIIDESMRGDYISINTPGLGTTPTLERLLQDAPGNTFNYGIMLAAGTNSFRARSVMLTGVDRLPDTELDVFRSPTIFDVAKANGYRTICMNLHGDFPDIAMRKGDIEKIDEVWLDGSFGPDGEELDFAAADFIRERLRTERGLFIFLEKMGLHVPYEAHYPGDDPDVAIFLPKLERGEPHTLEKRIKLVNSYKNGLHWNLEGFFGRLFRDGPSSFPECTIVWTSDHGQSLMEHDNLESHGWKWLEQALVPFLIFSTDHWTLEHLRRPADVPGTLSQMNIFPTLCSILCRD